MAKSISAEELQLRKRARRRLVGAIALVTIVAVFLPMVLEQDPKPVSQDISIRIPAPDSGIFTSKIVPVPPGEPEAKSAIAPAAPAKPEPAQNEPAKTTAVTPAVRPAAETPPVHDTEAEPPKKPAPAPPARNIPAPAVVAKSKAAESTEAKDTGGFVVQVAALNDAVKAKQIQEKIAAAGVKSYTEVVPAAKGNVTRVRAGPFASRDEADKMRDKLKGLGLTGNVVPK
jgi:DedD protein